MTCVNLKIFKMEAKENNALYPIAVLIDELKSPEVKRR